MKKKFILEVIKNQIAERKVTADELIQLNKITKLEEPFLKSLTNKKMSGSNQRAICPIPNPMTKEKGTLNLIEIDCLIEFIIQLLI